ncbi:MAG TPA: 4a-hydroxytetrahydrobiopterin dehydratase [Kofleriaceae bacterium]|nr:4a-hydroxytetrahydrobiopterin dehydratase [Kofleriaceae bacterium]
MSRRPPKPLSAEEIQTRMEELPAWRVEDNRLRRSFQFDSFVTAFGWMASCALVAEAHNHHPDWTNVYNRVEVTLWTHEADGLTERDFRLAREMSRLAAA